MKFDERLHNVNVHGVLAIDAAALATMLVAARFWLALLLGALGGLLGVDTSGLYEGVPFEVLLLVEVPAVLVILAAGRRNPGASVVWRRCWSAGRQALQVVFVLHILVFMASVALSGWPEERWGVILALCAMLDLACLLGLRSRYFVQLFAEFPA